MSLKYEPSSEPQTYELWDGETEPKCRVPWTTGYETGGPAGWSCPTWPEADGTRLTKIL